MAAIVIALNPAQLLAQARDGKRQQDLSALNQALNTIYALDQSVSFGTSSIVYTSLPDSTTSCATWNLPSLPLGWQYNCVSTSSLQNTNGTGWIPVNFKTTGVVSLSALPTDPVNTSSTGLYYTYVSGGSFQLASHLESSKYQATQGSDAMYTVGSNLNLAPFLSGLVGWWKFDETSGTTTADSSGYNNTGVMYSSTTPTYILTSSGCKAGNCGSFSSAFQNYVGVTTTVISDTSYTLSLWFKTTTANVSINQVDYPRLGSSQDRRIYLSGGNICSYVYTSEIICTTAKNYADGIWHHAIQEYGGNVGGQKVFVDGQLVVGGNKSQSDFNWKTGISFGYGAGSFLTGQLDDVRIYNRALSASEIQALYNATR